MHEMAHVLGLQHVDVSSEIMFPTATSRVAEFGPGDLTGLYAIGAPAGCLAQPDPWWLRSSMVGTAAAGAHPTTADDVALGVVALPTDPAAGVVAPPPLHCSIT
jgi:hypothetical protein